MKILPMARWHIRWINVEKIFNKTLEITKNEHWTDYDDNGCDDVAFSYSFESKHQQP
jgi:hypothetical protein